MSFADLAMDARHGDFDHVGSGALNRRIDGVAFGCATDSGVRGADITEITTTAGDRFNITALAGEFDRIGHVAADERKLGEIMIDNLHRFTPRNTEALSQPK